MRPAVITLILILSLLLVGVIFYACQATREKEKENMTPEEQVIISLPEPQKQSPLSVEEALAQRRSIREYKNEPLSIEEIAQLVWAGQGITSADGKRTAPSAGATYPLELYLAVKEAEELEPGLYRYLPKDHSLEKVLQGNLSKELREAALGQIWVEQAPVNLILTGFFSRTAQRYGERAERYVYMEAGHSAQNIYLQAESLGLGLVVIGAFYDQQLKNLLQLDQKETPLYVIPVGRVR